MIKQLRLLFTMLLLTIVGSASADSYVKVTSTDDITNGTYLIVYENGSVAFDGSLTTLDAASNVIDVTINDGVIEATEETDAAAFTINVDDGTLQSASGLYIGASSYANGLKTSEEADAFTNSFAIDSNGDAVITISFETNAVTLRYNKASDQNRFRYYKTGQQAIQLYKKVEGDTPTQVNIATLKSISPTTVTVGDIDEFTLDATFAEGTVADEDYEISWESSDPTILEVADNVYEAKKAGTVEITVSVTALDDETYKDVSKTFTVTVQEAVSALANIAALTEQTEAGEYAVELNNAVVTYVNGNYAYIQDESGAVVMYKSGHGLTAGQVLNGTVTVTFQLRNSNPQITALSGYNATDGTAPDPTEVAADAWSTPIATVLSQYFKVTGATITKDGTKYYVQLGDETVQLYGQGDARTIQVPNLDVTYTIVGFPTLYNTTKELQIFVQPVPEEEVVVVPTPTFNPAAGEVEAGTTVEVVCPEEAEGVEYSFDQVTWTEFTDPIEITETTTIYARAYDIDGNTSEVVSAKYTIKEVVPAQDVVIVEEDKTTFLFNTPGNEWGFPTDYATEAAEFTANGKTIEVGGPDGYKYNTSDKYLIFGKTDAYITLPAFDFPVGKIEVVGRENASGNTKQNIFVGETAISTETTGAKGTNEYIIPTLYQEAGTVYTLKVTSAHNSQVTKIIVYEADGTPVLADPELAFDVESFTATIGEENEFPVLANPNELPVTYTSSDEGVATIDEAGNITLVAAGETTITATSDETSEFLAGEASYLLVVEGEPVPAEEVQYQLVTSTEDITSGKYLIVYAPADGEAFAFDGSLAKIDVSSNTQAVTIENDVITTDQAIYFNIDVENGTLQSASGFYIGQTANSNGLKQSEDATAYTNTFAIDEDGYAVISVAVGENTLTMRYNKASDQLRFRYYKSGQQPIYLFKAVDQVEAETIPVKISSAEWATLYYSDKAFEIPEGVTAKIVVAIDDNDVIDFEDLNGIIPAGTAVALNGPQGTYNFKVVNDETVAPANNLLRGFDAPHLTEGGDIYYKLTVKNDIVGFYWGEENGEAFESGAHKAYLAIPAGASNAKFLALGTEDGESVDGINEVTASDSKNEYFNLNGTRVNTLHKGIYIVGGKKVVIK